MIHTVKGIVNKAEVDGFLELSLTCVLRNLYAGQVKKCQLELDMEQWTGSKLGKEYIKAVYGHLAYLTSLQTITCEMMAG